MTVERAAPGLLGSLQDMWIFLTWGGVHSSSQPYASAIVRQTASRLRHRWLASLEYRLLRCST